MLTVLGGRERSARLISRRDVLRVGALGGFAGLEAADVLRLQAASATPSRGKGKSVINIWLRGGPSHIDSVDLKPDAPAEIRGEFASIATNVPGIRFCEYLPKLAGIADKLVVVRGIKSNDLGDHTPHYIITGSGERGKRPAMGSIVSYLRPPGGRMPPYVSLMYEPPKLYDHESPLYCGQAHRPFVPKAEGLNNLSLARGVSLERLRDRSALLRSFDELTRAVDNGAGHRGDPFRARALEMMTAPEVRAAFDLNQESPATYERYGKFCEQFLLARRLAEAGVSVVTLRVGDWDTHERNFIDMRAQLPKLDQGFCALVSDLHERGLADDVAVVLWGEFGRAPRISRGDGRDHWPEAGAAILAGGGFRGGQIVGATDAHGGRARGRPFTPANVLSSLYRHLEIDPAQTIPDHNGRPVALLADVVQVPGLVS